MSDVTIGKLIPEGSQRDAVHIAVAPVIAGATLKPGTHIGFISPNDTEAVAAVDNPIGIVDPYLTNPVYIGQRFWMFLYPRSITSLNHMWTHPAFENTIGVAQIIDFDRVQRKASSEQWLREFMAKSDCPSYETVMNLIQNGKFSQDEYVGGYMDEEYMHFNGIDAHGDIPQEFWDHVEVVLDRPYSGLKPTYFSCSC